MPKKKIGLALSGGGARGFSHIGVLKVLAEHGIDADLIAGTSAGSIVGGGLAAGMSAQELAAMAAKVAWRNMTRPSLSPLGVLSNAPMGAFLRRHLPVTTFEQLAIPFAAVAYDLGNGLEVVQQGEGDLITAIQASCAVPGVFCPIKTPDGRTLVDGGVSSPIPTDVAKQMGADVVIGIDLISCGASFRTMPRTAFGMMFQSTLALLRAASRNQHFHADVVIVPQIAHLRPDQINKRDEFIELGEAAALDKIDEIKALLS